ncbi:MAG: metalloendopeptidase, partial [Sphingomonadales bacterium]
MRGFVFLVIGALALGTAAWLAWPEAQAQRSEGPGLPPTASRSLTQARAEAARARDRAAALDREARAATQVSERAIIAAAALAARVQQSEAALAGADAELASLRDQRRALDRRLGRERAPVAQLLAGLQTQVRRPAVLTMLQPGSLENAVRMRAVVAAVGPQIAARTASLKREAQRALSLERAAAAIATDRRALQADLSARRSELATLSVAQSLQARRAGEAADREAERAYAIAAEARDLSTLVRRLDGAKPLSSRQPARGTASGPTPYRLPVTGLQASSEQAGAGLTLLARPAALVVAPAAGRVAFAGPYRGYGEIVIIEHAAGWSSLVTGLAKARVAVGQSLV